jgi:endoglucanase
VCYEQRLSLLRCLPLTLAALVLACGQSTSEPPAALNDAGGTSTQSSAGAAVGGSVVATPADGGGSEAGGTLNAATGGMANTAPVDTEPPFAPTNIAPGASQQAYDDWKTNHLEDCSAGVWRVRWENTKLDATVSEGIGYGLLLTVMYDDRAAFDGLVAYSKLMRQPNQLMNWLRYGCDAHRETKYSGYPDNSASDADLDVAMSLLMAQCKWGDAKYGDEATTVIGAIKQSMFMDSGGLHVLQPGDSMWFDQLGNGCVNYSYMAPGYYRAFAKHVSADADFWNKAAEDTYELLAKASNASTGLVRNWGSSDGSDATADCKNTYKRASSYGSDAARTPWRIATDYLWFGTPKAKAWSDKLAQWVKAQDVTKVGLWYNLDGTPDMEAGNWDAHTAVTIGPFAVAAMTFEQAAVNALAAELLAIPTTSGSRDAEYFARMLRSLSLATLTGKFTQCGGK